MTISTINYSGVVDISREEQVVYDHLLYCVQNQPPDRLISNFHYLFIEAKGYNDRKVRSALEKIVNSRQAEQDFNFFFNRCCHIIVNHWQMQSQLQPAIREFIDLFNHLLSPESVYSRTSKRLRQLVKNFTQTKQYTKLQRLGRVINQKSTNTNSVGNLINRYPYLYQHCLLSEDSSYEAKQAVQKIQFQNQSKFEFNLSQYVTYQVRLGQMIRTGQLSKEKTRLIKPVKNPTLLTEPELGSALKQFVGKVEYGYTYRELSQTFLTYNANVSCYKSFKDNLYEYLVGSIDNKYGRHQFNKKLYNKLQQILPQCHHQKLNESLILRTGCQLMNFLVVENQKRPNHYVFVDLITNLGATRTVGLLLKLVLLYRKLKPYLEKRFSILFNHYESFAKEGVPWLVRSLENLHLAFIVYFGKADLSCLKHLM